MGKRTSQPNSPAISPSHSTIFAMVFIYFKDQFMICDLVRLLVACFKDFMVHTKLVFTPTADRAWSPLLATMKG